MVRAAGTGGRGAAVAGGLAITKGGELALALVRDRGGDIDLAPTRFRDDDRFKVVVTCAPGAALHAELVVFQAERAGGQAVAAFPLAGRSLACGNRVAFPGAFRITGREPATVCLVLGAAAPPSRPVIIGDGLRVADDRVCLPLDPEP